MTAAQSLATLVRAAALLATTLATALPAMGNEHTVFAMLSIDDADAPERCPVVGLLAVPAGWQFGDAAAVVIAPAPASGHDSLIAELLGETTAILEIADTARCRTEIPLLAKAALAEAIGPGSLVAIGYEAAGDLALQASRHGFLAGVGVSATAVRIAAGPPAPPEEQMARRWPQFCAALVRHAPIDTAACEAALLTPAILAGALR